MLKVAHKYDMPRLLIATKKMLMPRVVSSVRAPAGVFDGASYTRTKPPFSRLRTPFYFTFAINVKCNFLLHIHP